MAVHAEPLRLQAAPFRVMRDSRTVAAADFCRRRARHRGGLRANRLELLGNCFRGPPCAISERQEILAPNPDIAGELLDKVAADRDWCDLVLQNIDRAGQTADSVRVVSRRHRWYLREVESTMAYRVDLRPGFDVWLAGLESAVRASYFRRRSRLVAAGGICTPVPPGQFDQLFGYIESLHERRWGSRPARLAVEHYRRMAAQLAAQSRAIGSVLTLDGRVVSAALSLRAEATEYDLYGAFDPTAAPALSVGKLHLGYRIEQAARDGVLVYDLLGGTGKNTDYKAKLGSERTELVTMHVVRHPLLKLLYRVWDLRR